MWYICTIIKGIMICREYLFLIGLIFRISSVSPVAEIDADNGKPHCTILKWFHEIVSVKPWYKLHWH